jgi:phosphoenolpyruvate carboxykinase (diphosphate)
LVSFILCGYDGFSTAAGYIGSLRRIDHDISLLIPEIWSRLPVEQRDPSYLIEHGQLEKLEDFQHEGKTVFASRLGYRITERFVHTNFGKVFNYPTAVFDEAMLKPESQDMASFVDGINNVYEAQQRVALQFFEDGSINDACPPLKALLHIMANGSYEGQTINDPALRNLFTRDYLIQSDWYLERLKIKQQRDVALWQQHKTHIASCMEDSDRYDPLTLDSLTQKLAKAETMLIQLSSRDYLDNLQGTLGADWVHQNKTPERQHA